MEKYVEQFMFHCKYEKNLSEKTLKAYMIDTNQYITFLKNEIQHKCIIDVDKNDLKMFIKNLFEQEYKEKSIIRKLATIKAFYTYLEFEEIILISPFRKLNIKIKEPSRLPKTINLKDIKTILTKMYKDRAGYTDKNCYSYKALIRDIVIIEFLFATGMRVAEICNIKKRDIDSSHNALTIIGKGDKERTIHLCSDEIKKILREYISLFKEEIKNAEYLFINRNKNPLSEQSVRFMVKKYSKKANVKLHITPHMFRHSMATYLLEEGVDIRYIQNILGHSSISTTQIYTKVNLKHQKKILTTKHPRKKFDIYNEGRG